MFLLHFTCAMLLGASLVHAQSLTEYRELLQRGRQEIEQGNVEKGLNLWESVTDGPSGQLTDPRIGFSYIEWVTREHLLDKYEKASDLYLWGLSNPAHPQFQSELALEVERLEPIADRDDYKYWRKLAKEGRLISLAKSLTGFWKSMDPTLQTAFNERLLEHWKRIAYSKEHFHRATNTVYDTDDRALPYLKFGEPDRKRAGIINLNVGQVRSWISEGTDASSMPDLSRVSTNDSLSFMRNIAEERVQIEKMLNSIKLHHRYPRYEIWVYRNVITNNRNEKLIYIFGTDGDTGEFSMLNSLEDMMPSAAFRSISFEPNAVPPAFFLQLLYYGEMTTIDSYFADAYRELESNLYTARGPTRYNTSYLRNQNRSKLDMNRLTAPAERSTYASGLLDIPVDVQQYRLLDRNNNPYLATFVFSRPHRSFYIDQIKRQLYDTWAYSLNTSVISTDPNNEILFQRNSSQGMKTDSGLVEEMRPMVDYFEIPQDTASALQVVSVELRNSRMDSTAAREVLFPENVRALGKRSVAPPERELATDGSTLEMGDLIIGYKDTASYSSDAFGFAVAHDKIIPDGKNLMVHIEIYHLNADSAGPSIPFKIDYSVTTEKNFLQRLFSKSEETRLTLNFETTSTVFRDNLEVDTSPFKPGSHTLKLKVTDMSNSRTVEREVKFEIQEIDDEEES